MRWFSHARRTRSSGPILVVEKLDVYYGRAHALQEVSLSLDHGVTAVVGRNGMGKTTLCNAITGLVPASGSVRLDGEEILGLPPLSPYDAGATPLWNAFSRGPDVTPFMHLPSTWPLTELNPTAFRSRIPARDLAEADAADEVELNREIWESVRPGERMPAPRRAILQGR